MASIGIYWVLKTLNQCVLPRYDFYNIIYTYPTTDPVKASNAKLNFYYNSQIICEWTYESSVWTEEIGTDYVLSDNTKLEIVEILNLLNLHYFF
jgi:hypothetical protein